jgi:hypothetical protein
MPSRVIQFAFHTQILCAWPAINLEFICRTDQISARAGKTPGFPACSQRHAGTEMSSFRNMHPTSAPGAVAAERALPISLIAAAPLTPCF